MNIDDPGEFENLIRKHQQVVFEAYRIDRRRKRVLLAISLKSNKNRAEDVTIEADKKKIPTIVKIIGENWNKIPPQQRPTVKIMIKEIEEKL